MKTLLDIGGLFDNLRNFLLIYSRIIFLLVVDMFLYLLRVVNIIAYNPLWYREIIFSLMKGVRSLLLKVRNQL